MTKYRSTPSVCVNLTKALMKAANDGEFLASFIKYCAFHSIQLYLNKWRTNGLQKFICNFKTDHKSLFINKAFQLARSTPYLPIFVSRALIQYTLGLCQTDGVQDILGEVDVLILSDLLEKLDDDLNRNGDNISWYEMQVESETWLDCTSNSIERRSGCHDFLVTSICQFHDAPCVLFNWPFHSLGRSFDLSKWSLRETRDLFILVT